MADFETEFARRSVLLHALDMSLCLQDPFLERRQTAEASLIRNLPSLRPEDAAWIDRAHVHALLVAMDVRRPAVTVAILNAVAQIGDKRAFGYVRHVMGRVPISKDPNEMLIRSAANKCLEALKAHALRALHSEGLLRGSQESEDTSRFILLRAAAAANGTASTELLRPDDDDRSRGALRKEDKDEVSF